jgi:hypothetical protein
MNAAARRAASLGGERDARRNSYWLLMLLIMGLAFQTQAWAAERDTRAASISAFPDATTTGVPAGVTLTPSGSLVIDTSGAVREGLDIKGSVIINASNVTLKNCKVTDGGNNVVLVKPGITGAVVQNCEIDNLGAGGQGIAGQGTFLANNIHDCADGIDVRGDNTVIRDNFIHSMRGTADSHLDGIQADGGFSNLTIDHNTVINEQNQTSAVMLDNYWGPIDTVTITNNLLVGGGYTVYINEVAKGQAGGGPVTNVTVTNNRIGRGFWGTLDVRSELGHVPILSGNVDTTTGRLLPGQQTGHSFVPHL